jgi:hypothetical protein
MSARLSLYSTTANNSKRKKLFRLGKLLLLKHIVTRDRTRILPLWIVGRHTEGIVVLDVKRDRHGIGRGIVHKTWLNPRAPASEEPVG